MPLLRHVGVRLKIGGHPGHRLRDRYPRWRRQPEGQPGRVGRVRTLLAGGRVGKLRRRLGRRMQRRCRSELWRLGHRLRSRHGHRLVRLVVDDLLQHVRLLRDSALRRALRRPGLAQLAHRGSVDLRGECGGRRRSPSSDLGFVAEVSRERRPFLVVVVHPLLGLAEVRGVLDGPIRDVGIDIGARDLGDQGGVDSLVARIHHEPGHAGRGGDHRPLTDVLEVVARIGLGGVPGARADLLALRRQQARGVVGRGGRRELELPGLLVRLARRGRGLRLRDRRNLRAHGARGWSLRLARRDLRRRLGRRVCPRRVAGCAGRGRLRLRDWTRCRFGLLQVRGPEDHAVLVVQLLPVVHEIIGIEREGRVRTFVDLDARKLCLRGHHHRLADHLLDQRGDLRCSEHRRVRVEEPLQVRREVTRALIALTRNALQRVHHDLLELRWDALAQPARRSDVRLARHVEELVQILFEIEHLADDHLVEHDPRGEDVGAMVERVAPRLLGAHVVVLALDHAGRRLARLHRGLRDPEIDELDLSRIGDQHVLRRHITVHDPERAPGVVLLAMRVIQRRRDLLRDEGAHVERHLEVDLGALAQDPIQIGSVDVLHRDVVGLADAPEVERLSDVAVRELHRDLRLVDEHLDELLVLREVRMDHLQGDVLLEPRDALGLREVDLGHSADGDLTN